MRRRVGEAVALLLLLPACAPLLSGCALWRGDAEPREPKGVEVRPDAPPDYDVLVAQQHALEGRTEEALAAYQRAVAKDEQSPYLRLRLAEALARANRLDEALVHAERAYELDPDDPEVRALLAQLYRIRREPEAAERVLRNEAGEPMDLDAAFLLYQIYAESGRMGEALELAQWMADTDPDSLRAHVAMANAYQKLGQPAESEQALRRALEIEPGNLRLYSALARSMRERGDRDGEIAVYREVLEEHPNDHSTLLALAEAQMAEDDLEGAIATFEEIERRFPSDMRSAVRLGFLYYEARNYEQAAVRFERAIEATPEEYEISFFLGIVRRRSNDDTAALAAFDRIPPEHKHYSEARTQIAAIYEHRQEYGKALEEVERALAAKPSRALELYGATLRAKTGDFEGAVAFLETLLSQEPENDELYYNLGVVYGEQERTEEAIRYMHQALEHNPDNASALNYIGYTWAESGDNLDEAEAMIARALELRPDDGYIVDSMGWVYYMRARPLVESGQHGEARQYIDRALQELERADELTGGDPVISEHLGDTYLLLNERRRALDKFEEAVMLGPREEEQPDLYEKLESLRREFE